MVRPRAGRRSPGPGPGVRRRRGWEDVVTRPALTLVPPIAPGVDEEAEPAAPPAPAPPAPVDTTPELVELVDLPPDWPTAFLIAVGPINGAGAWLITHDPVTMVCWGLAGLVASVMADRWWSR